MAFILRLIIGGMLGSLGRDIYTWVKGKVEHTVTWQHFMGQVDRGLNATGNLLRHFFSIITTERL